MTLEIRPLSDALGAEVIGLDLSKPVAKDEAAALKQAFLAHQLLCLRSKPLSAQAFRDVARIFGTPHAETTRAHWVDGVPEISLLDSTSDDRTSFHQSPYGVHHIEPSSTSSRTAVMWPATFKA